MKHIRFWLLVIGLGLLAAPAAGQKKGGGSGDGGGGTGAQPTTVTFRDCTEGLSLHGECPVADDRVRSETGLPYIDGEQGVIAYVGSKANSGNIWLKLAQSTRELGLDFRDCVSPECKPPFETGSISDLSIKVDADAVRKSGVFGMEVHEVMGAPMRIYFSLAPDTMNFVDFNPNVGPRDPCKDKSDYVKVKRTGATSWEVFADANTLACVSEHNGFGGTYRMPFRFTVEQQ